MNKILLIARHEYITNVTRAGFIIMTLLIPLLGAAGLFIAAVFGGRAASFLARQVMPESQVIGVVDNLGRFTPLLPSFETQYRLFVNEETGRQAVQDKEIGSLLVIPADYMTFGRVTLVTRNSGFSAAATSDSQSLRRFFTEHLLRDAVDPTLRQRVASAVDVRMVVLDADGKGNGQAGGIASMMVPYFLGILLIVTIFSSSGYLLRSVAEEKASRVIEIVLSSTSATQLLAGKVIGLGAVGLTQVIVWLASSLALSGGAVALLGVAIPLFSRAEVFILAIAYYLLGFLVYAVLMASVGALGATEQESQQLAGIFSLIAALPMMLAGFTFTNPNMILMRVFSWIPLTAPVMMMIRLPMAEVPLVDILISLIGTTLTIPVILWAGAKVFRMGLLMYGKRPALKQIWQALRQA